MFDFVNMGVNNQKAGDDACWNENFSLQFSSWHLDEKKME